MPALFAYLIAVGLLLGGGYGALSWLAAPEPVKVASKAKPKPPPRYAANSEANSPEANLPAINDSDKAAPGSNSKAAAASSDQPPSSASQASAAASGQGAQAQVSGQARDQRTTSASAEVSSEEVKRYAQVSPAEAKQEAKQEERQPAQTVAAVSPGTPQAAASEPPAAAAKTVKRPRLRQAHRSDRRALALMTLRTIEFPDGRRVTQLLPYRSRERVLAFDPDE